MAKANLYKMEMVQDLPCLNSAGLSKVTDFMVECAHTNGPYASKLKAGERANVDYIAPQALEGAFAGIYKAMKQFDGHIDYSRLGNSEGLTRAGSNPHTLEHKDVMPAGIPNADLDWKGVFYEVTGEEYTEELAAEQPEYRHFGMALEYLTLPYAAAKLDRPSHSTQLNTKGQTKSPFKGGMDLVADLIMAALDDGAKASFKAALKARTEYNLANGMVGWGGPTAEYCAKCAETREERGITMARVTGTTKGAGIYTKMNAETDDKAADLVMSSYFEEHVTMEELTKRLQTFVVENCADKEKAAAYLKEREETAVVYEAAKGLASQKAEAEKLEAKLKVLDSKAMVTDEKLVVICGPNTKAALRMVVGKYKAEESAQANPAQE